MWSLFVISLLVYGDVEFRWHGTFDDYEECIRTIRELENQYSSPNQGMVCLMHDISNGVY